MCAASPGARPASENLGQLTGNASDSYLIAERDMDALMDQLANEKELKVAILEKKEKVRTVDFSKKMTVGNELAVVISNTTGQAANVTVKIAGE